MELFRTLDYGLLRSVVEATRRSELLTLVAFIGAELLIFTFFPVCIGLWVTSKNGFYKKNNPTAIYAVISVIVCLAVKAALAYVYTRPQPFISHPDLFSMGVHSNPQSFPSTYVLVSFAITLSTWFGGYTLLSRILLGVTLLITVSQVMAGVRYPSDVVGGLLISYLVTWSLWRKRSILKQII